MIVFRLSREKYKNDLSGRGAEIAGGRWNNKGVAMLYTSSSRALCMSEVLVHLTPDTIPDDYWLISIELPDNLEYPIINPDQLNQGWRQTPPPVILKKIGDDFIKNQVGLAIWAPSAVVQGDFNLLINPAHPDFNLGRIVETELFEFDPRLIK